MIRPKDTKTIARRGGVSFGGNLYYTSRVMRTKADGEVV